MDGVIAFAETHPLSVSSHGSAEPAERISYSNSKSDSPEDNSEKRG